VSAARARPLRRFRPGFARLSLSAKVGLAVGVIVTAVAFIGPFFAPHAPDAIIGAPYTHASSTYPLGLDYVGRDVLSRFLWGGRTSLFLALLGTVLGYLIGLTIGLFAAYRRGWADELTMRATDVTLAFPSLVLVLLLVSAFGSNVRLVVVAIAVANAPRIARIVRASSLEVVDLLYVQAAKARGERALYIVLREMLPNIRAPLLVDFGLRFTGSILLVAAVSFLGFGLQPPAADWGVMVGENRVGLTIQPWGVLGPVIALGLVTIGINLVIDGYGRSVGRSYEQEEKIAPLR
jgi:peptide/nickel transport system permease protein